MTRIVGFAVIVCAVVYLAVTLVDFVPQYSATDEIVAQQDELGLTTTTTNLRFHIGLHIVVDIIVLIAFGLLAWWLIGSETQQYGHAIGLAVLVVGSIIIRVTPIVPFGTARLSPAGAFFRCQVRVPVAADTSSAWVVIPLRKSQRVAVTEIYTDTSLIGDKELVLDFGDNQSLLSQYLSSHPPVTLLGSMNGTRVLAVGKDLYTVLCIKVIQIEQVDTGEST